MNSFAHYSFGAVAGWMFGSLGGIAPASPGFKKITILPIPGLNPNLCRAPHNSENSALSPRHGFYSLLVLDGGSKLLPVSQPKMLSFGETLEKLYLSFVPFCGRQRV